MRRRTVFSHIKSTADERAAWHAAAAAAGMTLSDLFRSHPLLSTKPVGRAIRRRAAHAGADPALLAGIAKAGNNLNQLARWCNSYKSAADCVQVLSALTAIQRQLSSFLPPHAPAQAGATRAEGEAD